ncbi:MAG: outer membrane protein TolC [Arcticibacterium sp.]|jgi:outer membrane protein TolC
MRLILVLGLLLPLLTEGQDLLSYEAFLSAFEDNHPAFKISKANIGQSEAALLSSRGVFDPTFSISSNNKTLDGKQYYMEQNPEIKWQTPYGLRIKAGNDYNVGEFLNTEVTPGNLSYMGLELPVLKGLLIDQERATRKQAEIMVSQSTEDQRNYLNDVYLEAIEHYWQWASAHQIYVLLQNQEVNAQRRFRITKVGFSNGAKSQADTVEAFLQVQNIELLQQEAFIDFRTKSIALSAFLWDAQSEPYLIRPDLKPQNMPEALINVGTEELVIQAKLNHPKLASYKLKLDGLAVERLLNRQSVLPTLDLKYNVLGRDYFFVESAANPYLRNNYKFGFDFKIPLLLRESRGKFEKTKFKIIETNLLQKQTSWNIENKIREYGLATELLEKQLSTASSLARNYEFMLRNEELKFNQGSSSLFLIISRENKLIEARQKVLNVNLKYIKAYYKQRWAAGLLAPPLA